MGGVCLHYRQQTGLTITSLYTTGPSGRNKGVATRFFCLYCRRQTGLTVTSLYPTGPRPQTSRRQGVCLYYRQQTGLTVTSLYKCYRAYRQQLQDSANEYCTNVQY